MSWKILVCSCLLMHVIIPIHAEYSVGGSGSRVPFGGECNRTARCDTRAWLRCIEGTCQCMKPEEMIYEEGSQKCVAKAGERCMYAVGEMDPNNYFIEIHSCVSNSACSADGTCGCNPDFYETAQGTCLPARIYGVACEAHMQCSSTLGFQCQNGVCGCDATRSTYDSRQGQCVGLAGSQCIKGKCTAHANCATNMCVCQNDFYWDVTGNCLPKVGIFQNCSTDFQCKQEPNTQLKCVNGVCNCDPAISVYATVQRSHPRNAPGYGYYGYEGSHVTQCVPLAGLTCSQGLCAPRSYCEYPYCCGASTGTCKCEPDLTLSRNSQCGRAYQGACTAQDECMDGLVCKNQQCLCEFASQQYDTVTKICQSKFGGPCNQDSGCVRNARCETQPSGAAGHCVCNDGFVPDAEDRCDVIGGGRCSLTSDCDSVSKLECINNVCRCPELSLFDPVIRKCVGKVGAHCFMNSTEKECTPNSHCHQPHAKLPARCACDDGYIEMPDYTCMAEQKDDGEDEDVLNDGKGHLVDLSSTPAAENNPRNLTALNSTPAPVQLNPAEPDSSPESDYDED